MTREPASDAPILVMACHGQLVGIDRQTGAKAWSVVLTDRVERVANGFAVELLLTPTRVYAAGWFSNELLCLAYPTGQELGRANLALGGNGRVSLLVDRGQLFAARDGQIACYSLDGEWRWTSERLFDRSPLPTALGVPGNVRQADDRFQP